MNLLLNKKNKLIYLILIISFILLLFFGIPSFARYKSGDFTSYEVWSGEIAVGFSSGDGSESNPYIISNGEELAFLATSLKDNDYEGYYFELSNDIVINDGRFVYDDSVKYIYNDTTYYVSDDKFYKESTFDNLVGSFNMFPSLNNFKGNLNGKYFNIYGLYINNTNASLFTNLSGNISNLYIDNALMIGSNKSAILADSVVNSNIKDVLVDGIVINKNINKSEKIIDIMIPSRSFIGSDSITLDVPDFSYLGNVTSIKLVGEYEGDASLVINENEFNDGKFEIEVSNEVVINLNSELETTIDVNFTSASFIVTYDYGVAAGIVGEASNATLLNCINKADIYGSVISSGIVGLGTSSIKNSYNNGNVNSDYISSGVIGFVSDSSVQLDHTYNTGILNGNVSGLVGLVNNSELTIKDSFIVSDNYLVDSIYNSTINSNNNYHLYKGINGLDKSTLVGEEDLKNSEFLTNYSLYTTGEEDLEKNVWIFDNSYPILYFDDIVNPVAELYVNSSMWNSYRTNLEVNKITGNITFMISDVNSLNVSSKYYYISNSLEVISREQLDSLEWLEYKDVVSISEEGIYTIYVKLIDDNGVVSYINSDAFVLDNTPAEIDVSLNDEHYNTLTDGEVYINGSGSISISASDNLSGVSSIQYYLSNNVIESEKLSEINEWIDYTDTIYISEIGESILYVKVVDNCGFITYASTPLIVNDGYVVTMEPLGEEILSDFIITGSSSIVYNIKYNNNKSLDIDEHSIITNISLPESTNMTLIDNLNHKVYGYVVDYSCNGSCSYSFDLFKEKGRIDDAYFEEKQVSNEDYTLILDFSDSELKKVYNDISINLRGLKGEEVIRPTLENNNKFTISNDDGISHIISTTFDGSIIYNSDSQTDILISNLISSDVYDTSYYDKNIGFTLEFVDASGEKVDTKYLKNFVFKIGDKIYSPGVDGFVRINLGSNFINDITLSVITYQGDFDLDKGTYYLRIGGFTSLDGLYSDTYIGDYINVPVIVDEVVTSRTDYSFDVNISNSIIDFNNSNLIDFNIIYDNVVDPNIKISFYKKDELTAYNQDYTLVDLQDYSLDNLNKHIDSVYNIEISETGTFSINLDNTKFDKTGYRFNFDLYDGNVKLGSISKYVIVR